MTAVELDVLVIGSGLAGFTAALHLANGKKVGLACKGSLEEGASWLAQGGIVAMLGTPDSLASHVTDTLVAGCHLNDLAAVARYSERSAAASEWLIDMGVPFTREAGGAIHLTREGGHGERRILHVADHTGHSIQHTLREHICAGRITVLEHCTLLELLVEEGSCYGALMLDTRDGSLVEVRAQAVIVGTGGVGQLYARTMSPASVTGDGLAACWRAGCEVANMEFIQFHPTGLYLPGFPTFLISEAVRGEGGILLNAAGERFMANYDVRLELAPRDVVARAILSEMTTANTPSVFLQVSHLGEQFIREHFPLIYGTCLERGLDITTTAIPVAPVTHYTCGGVVVDQHARTAIDGLYCVGEVAYTGLHGANRLASNSLLECIVDGQAAARHIRGRAARRLPPAWDQGYRWLAASPDYEAQARLVREQLQHLMWSSAGLLRSAGALDQAHQQIVRWLEDLYPGNVCFARSRDVQETFSLLVAALAVCLSARAREHSIGCHFREDFPLAPKDAQPSRLLWTLP